MNLRRFSISQVFCWEIKPSHHMSGEPPFTKQIVIIYT